MPKKIQYGIFGTKEVIVGDDGFIEVPVIIQASGCFAGAPPNELRICQMGAYGDDDFNKRYVAKLNRRTDLPLYLATAKVKVDDASLKKYTDDDLKALHLEPLED